jgi:hypothetical protein
VHELRGLLLRVQQALGRIPPARRRCRRPSPGARAVQRRILGQLLTISAATALLSYALYTIESENVPTDGSMALTIPFVAFALFRYLLLLNGARRTDAPDQILFTDPQILLAVIGFAGTALVVLLSH